MHPLVSKTLIQTNNSHTVYLPFEVIFGEHEDSVDKVAQVVKKLRVMFQDKVRPIEGTVLCLWPHVEQVESIDISRNISVFGIVPKHTHPSTL